LRTNRASVAANQRASIRRVMMVAAFTISESEMINGRVSVWRSLATFQTPKLARSAS